MIAPKDMLARHQQDIQADRDRKLGGGEGTAEEAPPAGRLSDETDYFGLADDSSRADAPNRHWQCAAGAG
jgi:hypothetical protein